MHCTDGGTDDGMATLTYQVSNAPCYKSVNKKKKITKKKIRVSSGLSTISQGRRKQFLVGGARN